MSLPTRTYTHDSIYRRDTASVVSTLTTPAALFAIAGAVGMYTPFICSNTMV